MGSHQSAAAKTVDWLTPPHVISACGQFDLDPCTPPEMPWETAAHRYTIKEDGLKSPWFGRVWLNPPYGKHYAAWLHKLSLHGDGLALIFARTETQDFFSSVWDLADAALFLKGRLTFHYPDGSPAQANGGAPSVLVAYGQRNVECLESKPLPGKFIPLSTTNIIVVGVSPSWFSVVSIAVRNHGDVDLKPVYEMVERIAPDKVRANPHWKEKVRQKVQQYRKQNYNEQH